MATSHKYHCEETRWTYGAELELADWPRNEPLPKGMAVDDGNWATVNSNGVAIDGPGKLYYLGGEILTAPSVHPGGPADQFDAIKHRWPETVHNYRSGLNVHVRVPGLRDDLKKLQHLQTFIHRIMPKLLPTIDPLPPLSPRDLVYRGYLWPTGHPTTKGVIRGAKQHIRKRGKDHHTLLPEWRLDLQMKARTTQAFFEAEALDPKTGKVHWAVTSRACVNLRQILQTDTIEFRHFSMPETPAQLLNTTLWCKMFLEAAFDGGTISAEALLREFNWELRRKAWPSALPYNHWLNTGFLYTSRRHHPPEVALAHIKEWLAKEQTQ